MNIEIEILEVKKMLLAMTVPGTQTRLHAAAVIRLEQILNELKKEEATHDEA